MQAPVILRKQMIQLTITGSLGRDCAVKQVEGGKTVINFSVAVNVGYGDKKTTIWVEAAYWTEKTGIAPYLVKGAKVLVTGEAGLRKYTKNDGTSDASMTIRVAQVELIGGKQEGQANVQSTGNTQTESVNANNITEPIDDLPF